MLAKDNLKQILYHLPDPIIITDERGNVLLSNSSAALFLDISLDQLLKSNLEELVQKGYYNKSYAVETLEKKCVASGIIKTRLNVELFSTSTPILDEKGNVKLVVITSRPAGLAEIDPGTAERELANQTKREFEYLRSYVLETGAIVAESKAMKQVLLAAHTLAQTDSTAVLFGETGTGKEVLAKYIHRHSKRAREAFIAVNCAALPEHLVESELFGYEKGAFTGASTEGKAGLFEAAHRGTLFLDEISEFPLPLQSKLLRVLETGEVRRLGSHLDRKIDFRLIVATNKDLKKMTEEGLFRSDLFYRLNVIPISIPPLRERPEDITALALKFLEHFNKKYGTDVELDFETQGLLQRYNWPGNVRELRNVIERMVISSLHDYQPDFLDLAAAKPGQLAPHHFALLGLSGTLKEVVKKVEEQYINHVLAECGGRMGEAAKKLGIYRTVLYRKLKAFDKAK
ncbi:MAG: sigma 54-interacting transcriptional regulator [Peptococcaceae bacterium]|nr:sigma 54-interacting transcriptional regulator [Peptococcaceae bacterium]